MILLPLLLSLFFFCPQPCVSEFRKQKSAPNLPSICQSFTSIGRNLRIGQFTCSFKESCGQECPKRLGAYDYFMKYRLTHSLTQSTLYNEWASTVSLPILSKTFTSLSFLLLMPEILGNIPELQSPACLLSSTSESCTMGREHLGQGSGRRGK